MCVLLTTHEVVPVARAAAVPFMSAIDVAIARRVPIMLARLGSCWCNPYLTDGRGHRVWRDISGSGGSSPCNEDERTSFIISTAKAAASTGGVW
jgi:hypothetical protein